MRLIYLSPKSIIILIILFNCILIYNTIFIIHTLLTFEKSNMEWNDFIEADYDGSETPLDTYKLWMNIKD